MRLVKSDRRWRDDHRHIFTSTVLPAAPVLAQTTARPRASSTGSSPPRKQLAVGAGLLAAVGAAAHWIDGHPLLTIGAIVVAALIVLLVLDHIRKKGN